MADNTNAKSKDKKQLYKNGKSPWRHFITVPVGLVLLLASFGLGLLADARMFNGMDTDTLGHASPVFTIMIPALFLGIIIIIWLVALIRFFAELVINSNFRKSNIEKTE